jgi:hypothetical protein
LPATLGKRPQQITQPAACAGASWLLRTAAKHARDQVAKIASGRLSTILALLAAKYAAGEVGNRSGQHHSTKRAVQWRVWPQQLIQQTRVLPLGLQSHASEIAWIGGLACVTSGIAVERALWVLLSFHKMLGQYMAIGGWQLPKGQVMGLGRQLGRGVTEQIAVALRGFLG